MSQRPAGVIPTKELLPDRVYLDVDHGAAGTNWPIGTPELPVSNITDALAIAVARRLTTIEVCGESGWAGAAIRLVSDFDYIHLIGQHPMMDMLNLNGHGVYGGLYEGFSLYGTHRADVEIQCTDCWLGQIALLTAPAAIDAFKCVVYNLTVSGGVCFLNDCIFRGGTLTLSGATPNCSLWGAEGSLTLAGMAAGTASIYGNGLNLTIAASNTGGTINIYGDVRITNNGAGVTVHDYTNHHSIAETTGTFVYNEASALEQTVFTLTVTTRSTIGSIWLDLVNATRNATIRLYHQVDGVNYREFSSHAWTTADADGVILEGFTAYRNVRVTLQCDGLGAGNVNVPYAVV
jgi:hypothetical protein